MSSANDAKEWWDFIKEFTVEVGGKLQAAVIVAFGVLFYASWRQPDAALRIASSIVSYVFGMFFHPIIIQGYVEGQKKQNAEIQELKKQVEDLHTTLLDVLSLLVQNGQSVEITNQVLELIKKHEKK